MKQPITDRQQAILTFIHDASAANGMAPTLREIGTHLGIRSTNGVNDHLRALEKKGWLKRDPMKSRAMHVIGPALESAAPLAWDMADDRDRRSTIQFVRGLVRRSSFVWAPELLKAMFEKLETTG